MRRRTKCDDGIGPLTIVLLLIAALLFGRLLASGIDRTFAIEDARIEAHKASLVAQQ